MQDDLDKTFGEIFKGDANALRDQLIDIQQHKASREESLQWAQRMRFLDISDVPYLAPPTQRQHGFSSRRGKESFPIDSEEVLPAITIPIIEDVMTDEERPPKYLAVSWKWSPVDIDEQSPIEVTNYYEYHIKRPGEPSHESKFPHAYMDRVIKVAQKHRVTKIWIDIECIYQRDGDERLHPKDKDLGVEVMDLVYENAFMAVGLLTTSLNHQEETDVLLELLNGESLRLRRGSQFELDPDVNVPELQMLILRILNDLRWDRCWIFQEDHLASYKMKLLMPCLEPMVKDGSFDLNLGEIWGELEIPVPSFRQSVTEFCLAHEPERWPATEILRKAKRYKTFNTFYNRSESTCTYPVLFDICNRSVQNEQDRIPILANALRFSQRLDTSNTSPIVTNTTYSLSAVMLASILINGEIIHNDPHEEEETSSILEHTLLSYMRTREFEFGPPNPRNDQYFVDHCRFGPSRITPRGMETSGWMFKVSGNIFASRTGILRPSIDEKYLLQELAEQGISRARGARSQFNQMEQEIIQMICRKLKQKWPTCQLADLMLEKARHYKAFTATSVFLKMMCAIIEALLYDDELYFARLLSEPDDGPPSAIFIAPSNDAWREEDLSQESSFRRLVFVSWHKERGQEKSGRLATLNVATYNAHGDRISPDEIDEESVLQEQGWVNGIWDARGKGKGMYTFLIPGIPAGTIKGSKKRKRGTNDDDL